MPIEIRFKCKTDEDFLKIDSNEEYKEIYLSTYTIKGFNTSCVVLDIPTAIKLSKTIRTHINKVKSNNNE